MIRPRRRWIGVASAVAVALFVVNPEIFALSYVISSIGFDVFLLFLSFQLKDQFSYLWGALSILRKRGWKSLANAEKNKLERDVSKSDG